MSEGTTVEERYSKPLSWMHWIIAAGTLGCIGTVQVQMNSKDKKLKGQMMWIHKSLGTTLAVLVPTRVGIRLASKIPAALPGSAFEHMAANASHIALYGMLIAMPTTGVAMGYFGGKGLPFWTTTIPGAKGDQKRGDIAKNAFKAHKLIGQGLEYFLPIHVGAAFFHAARG